MRTEGPTSLLNGLRLIRLLQVNPLLYLARRRCLHQCHRATFADAAQLPADSVGAIPDDTVGGAVEKRERRLKRLECCCQKVHIPEPSSDA